MNNFELVVKAYNELIAEGKIFPTTDKFEEHKALVTRRAAYYLNGINPSIGLLSKTSGNNVQGLSVDCLFDKQFGMEYDIGTDVDAGDGKRMAQIIDSSGRQQTDLSRWVKPQREWCDFATQNNPPENPPVEEPEVDLSLFVDAISARLFEKIRPDLLSIQDKMNQINSSFNDIKSLVEKIKPCPFSKVKF